MFHFKALELMNWDCYPHYRVPLDGDIILLVGPNGSGKTTFLDGLRVLLNAPRLSKGRTLHHYIDKDVEIAMIKGVVTNQLVRGRRPFAHLGIYGDMDISLVCLMHNQGPQKIEKEYFIAKGDLSLEEIKNLKGGLKSLQYSRQLEEAGVSRSTLKLIALEQGETDRIGQLSSEDLLQLVMDITGNREIIKKYDEARHNYCHSYQQLVELRTEYNKICQQNEELERQARQAQAFKELLEETRLIEQEKLPLSKWYHVLSQVHDIEKICGELRDKKVTIEKRIKAIFEEMEASQGKITHIEHEQQELKHRQGVQEKELNLLHQQIGQCNSQWQRLDSLRSECEKITEELPLEKTQDALERAQEHYYQCKNKVARAQEELASYKKELSAMGKKRVPTYFPEIGDFRETLDKERIENLIFAECIEIINPKWQLAIEAFLGRDRFSIYVSPEDFLYAKKLGEKHHYPYYISSYQEQSLPSRINPHSILANLKILDHRISGRLPQLNDIILVDTVEEGHEYKDNITITESGYRQDRRGGIFIARDVKFYCGGMAIELGKQEIAEQIARRSSEIENLRLQLHQANRQVRDLEQELLLMKKREEWLSSKEAYQSLKIQGEKLLADSEILVQAKNKTMAELENLSEERNKIIIFSKELQKEKEQLEKETRQIGDALYEKEQILLQVRWQKEELDKQIPSTTQSAYTPDQMETPVWLEHKLQEVKAQIEMFPGCRDLSLIALYEHEQKELQSKKKQLDRQEDDQRQRTQELEKCREDYKDMIVSTATFYNKAVKELAELAGCKMRVFLELGKGESLIEDAKLYVRIAFDQKHEVDIHDKSLSGGQDVIASLILLVALSRIEEERSTGFFIMDEHNAHLDMLRIMEVGHFLRSTHAQFVLTTPTTENVAALSVADLIMTFTKKDGKSPYAPKPRYIRRM
jgi:chromosome segregation ATPase